MSHFSDSLLPQYPTNLSHLSASFWLSTFCKATKTDFPPIKERQNNDNFLKNLSFCKENVKREPTSSQYVADNLLICRRLQK